MTPVLAADKWTSNAELILDVARLGYLRQEWVTLDSTYGKGVWWKKFRPTHLIWHDLKKDFVDFRDLPYTNRFFKVSAFDPPYVSKGGRKTSTIQEFDERYGLAKAASSPQLLQEYINEGFAECVRVTDTYVLQKTCDYVSSGKLYPGVYETIKFADSLGCTLVDRFHHIGVPRQQPKRTRKDGKPVTQKHARNNLSTLLVFRVPAV